MALSVQMAAAQGVSTSRAGLVAVLAWMLERVACQKEPVAVHALGVLQAAVAVARLVPVAL